MIKFNNLAKQFFYDDWSHHGTMDFAQLWLGYVYVLSRVK